MKDKRKILNFSFIFQTLKTMKLTYLDTSNISLICKKLLNNEIKRIEFIDNWRTNNCGLAISQATITEIFRHDSLQERLNRIELLSEFYPIKIEMKFAATKEILSFFINNKFINFEELKDIESLKIFHKSYSTKSEIHSFFRMFKFPTKYVVKFAKFLNKISWKNEDTRYKNPINKKKSLLIKDIDPLLLSIFSYSQKVPYTKAISLKYIEDLSRESLFRKYIRMALKQHTEIRNKQRVEELCNKIDIADCGGFWLSSFVKSQMLKAKDTDATNETDLHHLQYLPYVDMFFSDKRVREMTTQVLRFKTIPNSIKDLKPPISIPNKFESLEEKLFS